MLSRRGTKTQKLILLLLPLLLLLLPLPLLLLIKSGTLFHSRSDCRAAEPGDRLGGREQDLKIVGLDRIFVRGREGRGVIVLVGTVQASTGCE